MPLFKVPTATAIFVESVSQTKAGWKFPEKPIFSWKKYYSIKPQFSYRRIRNFGKTLRCFLGYFPRFNFCLQPRRWVLKLLLRTHFLFHPSLSLSQWVFKEEWFYHQRFPRELPPQRASFCALDIQLWQLSMAAAGAGRDILHHEVPPWSIMHPAGLLQGIQALTFLLS